MKIYGAFYNRTEAEQFHLKEDKGEPLYLFVHFYNPVIIVINGEEITVQKDACIIYSPNEPQEYYSLPGGFTNDYVKFIPDKNFIEKYNLPLNEIFYINQPEEITNHVSYITWALTDIRVNHQEEMEKHLVSLFGLLSNCLANETPMLKRARANKTRLAALRTRIIENPGNWTVDKMAEEFYLTRSHFCTVYSSVYGISPGKDLLRMRMIHAAKLLTDTDKTVNQISSECGYKNSENFIRSFKKYHNLSPLQYRKAH